MQNFHKNPRNFADRSLHLTIVIIPRQKVKLRDKNPEMFLDMHSDILHDEGASLNFSNYYQTDRLA